MDLNYLIARVKELKTPNRRKRKKSPEQKNQWDPYSDEFTSLELGILKPCLSDPKRCFEAAVRLNRHYFERVLTPLVVANIVLCGTLILPREISPEFSRNYSIHITDVRSDASSDVINLLSISFANENIGFGVQRVNHFVKHFAKEKTKAVQHDKPVIVKSIEKIKPQQDISTTTFARMLRINSWHLSFTPFKIMFDSAIISLSSTCHSVIFDEFFNFILCDFEKLSELLLLFLYKTAFLIPTTPSFHSFYIHCMIKIMDSQYERVKRADRYNFAYFCHLLKIITEAPFLPTECFERVKKFCNDPDAFNFGYKIISSMLIYKNLSFDWVGLVLELSTSTHENIREMSVSLILDIYSDCNYSEKIDNFILSVIESLPQSLAGYERHFEISLNLVFNMLKVSHKFLKNLFNVYDSLPQSHQACFLSLLNKADVLAFRESVELVDILVSSDQIPTRDIVLRFIETMNSKKNLKPEFIETIKIHYKEKSKDIYLFALIMKYLSQNEIFEFLPDLILTQESVYSPILVSLLELSNSQSFCLSPIEILFFLHKLEDKIDLKILAKAITICIHQRSIFTQELLGATLQKLIESTPLPTLSVRTMIQSLSSCPKLVNFIMGLLQKLVNRQVWKKPKLWHGFVKCCEKTQPQSFPVLLQLPIRYLEESFEICPDLKTHLIQHVQSMSINQRALLHQSVLQVLESKD